MLRRLLVTGLVLVASAGLLWAQATQPGQYISGAGVARGSITIPTTGVLKLPDGTVSAPSLTFTNDLDSGVYRIGADNLGVAVNGTKILDISATGLTVTGTISGTTTLATSLAGGLAGSLPYQTAVNTTTFLGIGTSTYILTSTGSAPQWSAPSGITVGTATNIAGGAAGSLPYQTAAGTTTTLGIGTAYQVLMTNAGATAPAWTSTLGATGTRLTAGFFTDLTVTNAIAGSVTGAAGSATAITVTDDTSTAGTYYPLWTTNTSGNQNPYVSSTKLTFNPNSGLLTATGFSGPLAGNASTATSLAGGGANQIPYQSGVGTTAFITAAASSLLVTNGSNVPSLATDIPTAVTIGSAYIYRAGGTDVTLADGGTSKSLTAAAGGVVWTDADSMEVTAAGSTGQLLRSTGTTAPAWTTATYPATVAAGDVLYGSALNVVSGLTKGTAYQVFAMNSGATLPAWTSTLGAAGTRLTAGYFVDLTVTNAISGSVTGNAGTATALAANGANCSAGNYPLGVDASGAVESCTALSAASVASATNATNAANIAITNDTTTAATMYPVWVTTTTGNLPAKVSSTKLSFVPSTGILTATGFSGPLTGNVTGNVSGTAASFTGNLTGDVTSTGMATAIASGVIVNADINASAGIVDTKLATISTAGKVSNSATTATSASTVNAIVARDASGNFSANAVTMGVSIVSSPSAYYRWYESDGAADAKYWDIYANGGALYLRAVNDAYSAANNVLSIGRSGYTISSVTFTPAVTFSGTLAVTGNTTLTGDLAVNGDDITADGNLTITPAGGTTYLVGAVDISSTLSMSSQRITDLATPTADTDAATKAYVDSVGVGIDLHDAVRAATTANGTLASDFENGDTIDGVVLATNDRILLKNQSTASQNGIYVVQASGAPARAGDMDADAEVSVGSYTFVTEGTVNAGTGWMVITDPATLGTNDMDWAQFSASTTYTAGSELDLTGTVFSVEPDLDVTTLDVSGAVAFAGTVALGNAAADNITINGTVTSNLIFTDNTYDIGASGATRPRNLFLAGNATIGGTVAITGVTTLTAQPILSSLTASQAVFTDGSKGLVSNAITGTGNVVMSASPTLTGTIGAAAMTLSSTLGVTGATTLTGALAANGGITVDSTAFTVADTTGNVATTGTLSVTGATVLNGGLTMDSTAFTVADTSGNTGIGGTLAVTGATTLTGALAANGGITVDSTAFIVADTTGNVTTTGTLTVGGTVTLTALTASQIVATDGSKQLTSVATTGSGSVVLANTPTLVTPVLGAATATSINDVTLTDPGSGATLTLADGKTLTVSNTLTFTGTDASSVAFGAGGTVAYTTSKLSAFAATTSAELAGVISDEIGSGSLQFATRSVEEVTTTKSPSAAESTEVYFSSGTNTPTITLPTAAAGLTYTFVVPVAYTMTITAASGDTIRISGNVTAAAGSITSAVAGSSVTLVAIDATQWVATSAIGSWSF